MSAPQTVEQKWLLDTLHSLQEWERQSKPAKDLSEAIDILSTMSLLPQGLKFEVMHQILAEAGKALGRKAIADDFKGNGLIELLKRVSAA